MFKTNHCFNCKVNVSNDIKYCPFCGKCLNESDDINENESSFPIIDMSYIYREKWVKKIRDIFWLVSIISVFINIFFITNPLWFPYVLVSLYVIYKVAIFPAKSINNYVRRLPQSALYLCLLFLFIDIYDAIALDIVFGWSFEYVCPSIMTVAVIACMFVALLSRTYDITLIQKICFISIGAVVYFLIKVIFFASFHSWPIFMLMIACIFALGLAVLIKRNRLKQGMGRNFHL